MAAQFQCPPTNFPPPIGKEEDYIDRKITARGLSIEKVISRAVSKKFREKKFRDEIKGFSANSLKTPILSEEGVKEEKSAMDDSWAKNKEGLIGILWPTPDEPWTVLLVFLPLGVAGPSLGFSDTIIFWVNLIALVPLAKILGDGTDNLSKSLGSEQIAGLLNATFGNAVEMMVSVFSIKAGLLDVVKASLLGSVLSNSLLVLGSSLFLGGVFTAQPVGGDVEALPKAVSIQPGAMDAPGPGGYRWTTEKEQKFSVKAVQNDISLLLLACMTFILPSIFQAYPTDDRATVLTVSRIGACLIMSAYVASLLFNLYTHTAMLAKAAGEDDEDEEAGMSTKWSLGLMMTLAAITSYVSDILVDAIKGIIADGSVPAGFIGVILLPIAGNACEHAGALRFAMQDKPGLSISCAVSSSSQVALCVVPFSVIVAWGFGQPLNLDFGILNCAVLLLSVFVVQSVLADGRSNWLKGYMLVIAYIFIGVLYWFLPPATTEV